MLLVDAAGIEVGFFQAWCGVAGCFFFFCLPEDCEDVPRNVLFLLTPFAFLRRLLTAAGRAPRLSLLPFWASCGRS